MKRKMFITAILVACFAVCLAAVGGLGGKWKGSLKDTDSNDHLFHLNLITVNGEKLVGTAQAEGDPLDINDGKIDGNNFTFNVKDHDGNVIPVDGKYIATGDSISLNFKENEIKHHVTFVRDGE